MHHTVAWLGLSLGVVGCTLFPALRPPVYVPEIAGIVRTREVVGQDLRYELADGRTINIPFNAHFIGRQPAPEDLLLAGSQPDRWVMHVRLVPAQPHVNPEGCYQLFGVARATATHVYHRVNDAGTKIEIAFPKAVNWTDMGFMGGSDALRGERTCINRDGEAFDRH